jgi:hypothetical protein
MSDDIVWQDWVTDGMFDHVSGVFHRNGQPVNHDNTVSEQELQLHQFQRTTSEGDTSFESNPGTHKRELLNDDVIAEILATTCVMPPRGLRD